METDELSKDGDIEYQRRIELETQDKETCLIKSNLRIPDGLGNSRTRPCVFISGCTCVRMRFHCAHTNG